MQTSGDAVALDADGVMDRAQEQSSLVSATEDQQRGPSNVVFASSASYQTLILIPLLLVAPLVMILSIVSVFLDSSLSPEERRSSLITLGLSTLLIVVMYLLVMPKRFEVRSDASIAVVTLTFTYTFGHVTAAYNDPPLMRDCWRPRLKFATNLNKRVLVRRKHGGWDIVVSPDDPNGLTAAVWKVAHAVEDQNA